LIEFQHILFSFHVLRWDRSFTLQGQCQGVDLFYSLLVQWQIAPALKSPDSIPFGLTMSNKVNTHIWEFHAY